MFDLVVNALENDDARYPSLHLGGTADDIPIEDVRRIAAPLATNTTLVELNVNGGNIGDAGTEAIANALEVNSALLYLTLSFNNIGKRGTAALSNALKRNRTLTALNLNNNGIDPKLLAEAFRSNNVLVKVMLHCNNIYNEGAEVIADALKSNSVLTWLSLNINKIGDTGAAALANILLKDNCALQLLALGLNQIGDEGATAFAEALKINNILTNLNLSSNTITNKGATAFSNALKVNHTLTFLNLENNGIDASILEEIKGYLERNQKLAEQLKQYKTKLVDLVNHAITGSDISESLNAFINELEAFNKEYNIKDAPQLLLLATAIRSGLEALNTILPSAQGNKNEITAKPLLQKKIEAINEKLNFAFKTLQELESAYPMARLALADFGSKFIQYAATNTDCLSLALHFFSSYCLYDLQAAETLFHTLFTIEESKNPFLDVSGCFPSYSPAFFGSSPASKKLAVPEKSQEAEQDTCRLMLLLGKQMLCVQNYGNLERILGGLKTGKNPLSFDLHSIPSLSAVTGLKNPKIMSFDKLRELTQMLCNICPADNNLRELIDVVSYYTKEGFYALLHAVRNVINVIIKDTEVSLNKELLTLVGCSVSSIVPYEGFALDDKFFLSSQQANNQIDDTQEKKITRFAENINIEEVTRHYKERDNTFVHPCEQKLTELLQRAIRLSALRNITNEALKLYTQYLEDLKPLEEIKQRLYSVLFHDLKISPCGSLTTYVAMILIDLDQKDEAHARSLMEDMLNNNSGINNEERFNSVINQFTNEAMDNNLLNIQQAKHIHEQFENLYQNMINAQERSYGCTIL